MREDPKDEVSSNAKFLERGGFIFKNSAGIYTYLPLGWRVLQKIAKIIREEMASIGGEELLMPSLVEKKYMEPTGRWDVGIGLAVKGKEEKSPSFVLGWTHEEVLTAISKHFIHSYQDLPKALYQIQTKFRNEPRAKSGLLRGREFIMKDLYSFHADDEDFESYYSKVAEAYDKIFRRCGLKAIYTLAAGGVFTKSNTHEFQVISDVGEDTIFVCSSCEYSENKEISGLKDGDWCPRCKGKVQEKHAIEVGNIFSLGTKYSEALGLWFIDKNGSKKYVIMGSYGIGLGRVMGTVVEVHHDERGVMWPEEIAPFTVHMISLGEKAKKEAQKIYENLLAKGVEVLYDDRDDKTPGEKFADADLIGIPWRVVVSEKTILAGGIEIKSRSASKTEILTPELLFRKLKLKMQKSK